MLFHFVAL